MPDHTVELRHAGIDHALPSVLCLAVFGGLYYLTRRAVERAQCGPCDSSRPLLWCPGPGGKEGVLSSTHRSRTAPVSELVMHARPRRGYNICGIDGANGKRPAAMGLRHLAESIKLKSI